MKSERAKGFISGVITASLVISLIGAAGAAVGQKMLKADYTNIKISVDGTVILPTDASGAYVEPFAVNGTTYLPVRAVANAVGYDVDWDQSTKTVLLFNDALDSNVSIDNLYAMQACAYFMQITDRLHIFTSAYLANYPSPLHTKDNMIALLNNYLGDYIDRVGLITESLDPTAPYFPYFESTVSHMQQQIDAITNMANYVESDYTKFKSYGMNETSYWTKVVSDIENAISAIN